MLGSNPSLDKRGSYIGNDPHLPISASRLHFEHQRSWVYTNRLEPNGLGFTKLDSFQRQQTVTNAFFSLLPPQPDQDLLHPFFKYDLIADLSPCHDVGMAYRESRNLHATNYACNDWDQDVNLELPILVLPGTSLQP